MGGAAAEEAWPALALRLVSRGDFWADSLAGAGWLALGAGSLAWEGATAANGSVAMITGDTAHLAAAAQAAGAIALAAARKGLLETGPGRALFAANMMGLALQVRRVRSSLTTGNLLREALERCGITTMADPTWRMIQATVSPVINLVARRSRPVERISMPYASLAEVDPKLDRLHKRSSKRIKLVHQLLGRGSYSQWLSIDIIRPTKGRAAPAASGLPVLLNIHGGAWTTGDKLVSGRATLETIAAEENVIVCSANYRLAPEVRLTDMLHDCKRALHWVKENIAQYGGDPAKVCVSGESAGGHLTALMALTANNPRYDPPEFTGREDTSMRAAIDFFGVHDILDTMGHYATMNGRPEKLSDLTKHMERVVIRKSLADDLGEFESASPSHILDRLLDGAVEASPGAQGNRTQVCPIMLVHGNRDTLTALDDSIEFHDRLVRLRQAEKRPPCDVFVTLPGARHAFGIVTGPRSAALAMAIGSFIHHHCDGPSSGNAKL